MVVAIVALLVALGGTSIAAVTALPLKSVGTPQLKDNAVISSKVKPHSLLKTDFAVGQVPRGPQGPQGPPGAQGLQGASGPSGPAGVASPGYVAQVVSQTSTSASSTNSTSYVDLASSTQTITVPTGETAKLYAWFSAESACTGTAGNWCVVRITVDGIEMSPASDADFAFDSVGSDLWEGHSIVRVSDTLSAGNHTVKVQSRTTSAGASLSLDDWALVIQRTKQ
jgi:hypothetical protein